MSAGIVEVMAELEEQILGIRRAFVDPPRSVASADLPCFLNFVGPATFDVVPDDVCTEQGEYTALLFVAPAQSGAPGEASAACRPWLDTVRDFFAARPTLDNARYVLDGGLVRRGKPRSYDVAGTAYLGVEFVLSFIEMFNVEVAE